MTTSIEQEGKTVQEAIDLALKELNVTRNEVKIEILDEGNKGLFGMIGSKLAKVRVTKENGSFKKTALKITKELLELIGVSGEVKEKGGEDDISILEIESKDSALLIGKRGQTLNALQFLVNLLAVRETGEGRKVLLDTENYRARRRETLIDLALKLAGKAKDLREELTLEPMNPYERHIIHVALQDNNYVTTKSIGHGEYRRVVIIPERSRSRISQRDKMIPRQSSPSRA